MTIITRIYNEDNGRSQFQDLEVAFGQPQYAGWPVVSTPPEGTANITFHRAEAGTTFGWHPAPRRQYIITLSGQVEIEAGDGTVRRFGPATVFIVEDLAGRGHLTKFVGNEPCTFIFVPLAE